MQELNLPYHVIEVREEAATKASAAGCHLASHRFDGAKRDRLRSAGRAAVTTSTADSFLEECVVSRPPADEAVSKPLKRRRRVRQTVSLQDRLVQQAREDRVQARSLPPGREREELLRHARRAESASQMTEWLTFRPSKPLK
jgi:hypothetical protein